jgi:outer membrane protein OmpA-like peptidoglycan-associated protein
VACGANPGAVGADIDAVGAIGSAQTISLNASVLFDFNESKLKPGAKNQLNDASREIQQSSGGRILIEGHTDNVGSIEYNQVLSENRALAVREYLVSMGKLQGINIEAYGYGKSRPIASNDTEKGREKNRSVEIIIIPRAQ